MVITAVDEYGNLATVYEGTAALSDASGTLAPAEATFLREDLGKGLVDDGGHGYAHPVLVASMWLPASPLTRKM